VTICSSLLAIIALLEAFDFDVSLENKLAKKLFDVFDGAAASSVLTVFPDVLIFDGTELIAVSAIFSAICENIEVEFPVPLAPVLLLAAMQMINPRPERNKITLRNVK
jgi:hypothetical protein